MVKLVEVTYPMSVSLYEMARVKLPMYIWMAEGLLTVVSISMMIPLPLGSSPGSENLSILMPLRPLKAVLGEWKEAKTKEVRNEKNEYAQCDARYVEEDDAYH